MRVQLPARTELGRPYDSASVPQQRLAVGLEEEQLDVARRRPGRLCERSARVTLDAQLLTGYWLKPAEFRPTTAEVRPEVRSFVVLGQCAVLHRLQSVCASWCRSAERTRPCAWQLLPCLPR